MTRALLACAAGALVAAGGCKAKEAGPGGPYAKMVSESVPQIEDITGLKFKTPPRIEARSKDQVRSFVEARFKEEQFQRELQAQAFAYRRLGLIPDTMDLERFMADMLAEQIAGYYDPKTKVLYVVQGAANEQVGFVVQHELVHALQDQYINLDSILHIVGDNDRALASQAVFEGQASLVPILAAMGGRGNIAAQLPVGWDQVRDMIRQNKAEMPVFARAPLIVQETALFPYLSGAEFMKTFMDRFPDQSAFARMPRSTEQVMHPSAYFGIRADTPAVVTLPAPTGGASESYQNNLGEFELRVFLFQHLNDQNAAVRGAAGWDGDRYMIVRTPAGEGLVWLTVWDSPLEAAEFTSVLGDALAKRFASAPAQATPDGGKRYTVGNRTVTTWGGEVDGHAVVLYTDVPAGAPASLIDVQKVRIGR